MLNRGRLSRLERTRIKAWRNTQRVLSEAVVEGRVPIGWAIKAFNNSWVVKCPYCKQQHLHARHEGLRQSHCQGLCGQEFRVSYVVKVKPGAKLVSIAHQEDSPDAELIYLEAIKLKLRSIGTK
jgi:hypothetical protein